MNDARAVMNARPPNSPVSNTENVELPPSPSKANSAAVKDRAVDATPQTAE